MTPRDLWREALGSLLAHRLRAILSLGGIVLGIATIITALAIGEGARRSALEEIGALGVDNIFLRSAGLPDASSARQWPGAPVLTLRDADAITATLSGLRAVGAARVARADFQSEFNRAEAELAGITASWADILDLNVAAGRWLSTSDERERRRVAIIGSELARGLFGARPAVGARVVASGTWFLIVGVLARDGDGQSGAIARGFDPDLSLMVPIGAMDLSLGRGDAIERVHEIAVRVSRSSDVEPSSRAIAALAAARHRDGGHELIVPRQLLAARLRARRTFDIVLAAVGLIALLISGFGIMNIMLASVAERTHEIGVRRAVGARASEVLAQFALEASALCVAGGMAGVPLGMLLAVVVAAAADWPVTVSGWSIALALALAASVGLAFGIYPARVAARVDPIQALRA